ncbi:MAG: hypothetical protein V4474_03525 [Patescibacteria group bacterium]
MFTTDGFTERSSYELRQSVPDGVGGVWNNVIHYRRPFRQRGLTPMGGLAARRKDGGLVHAFRNLALSAIILAFDSDLEQKRKQTLELQSYPAALTARFFYLLTTGLIYQTIHIQ